ncbi:MAG TPA: universal stress protein [Streptosporangiaceae bacterium]
MNQELKRRHILAGVNGSLASLAALRWAGREAALRGVGLLAVRAWEDLSKRRAPYASHAGRPAVEEDQLVAGARLAEAVRSTLAALPDVTVTVKVTEGLTARVLLDHAEGAELLVLGSAATAGPHAVGPVAQACLRHAPCPVVVVSADMAGVPVPA